MLPAMYRERASSLAGAVAWQHTTHGRSVSVLPDGCMDLIWADERLLVAGPDTVAHEVSGPVARYVGLRFAPGTGPAVLGVSAVELRDQRVPLSDLWPAGLVRRCTELTAAAARPAVALEDLARQRLRHRGGPRPEVAGIVARLRAGVSVADTARAVDWGPRRLHRHCLDAFGYGAKTLARILRMNAAVDLARAGTPFAMVAATAGYADQAHLAREVRALAGAPLGALVRPRD